MRYLLTHFTIAVLALSACKSAQPQAGEPLASTPPLAGGGAPVPVESATDPAKALVLTNFQIGSVRYGTDTWPVLTFSTSGTVDFTQWKACTVAKPITCKAGSVETNSAVLVNLPSGVLQIEVQPCAELTGSSKTASKVCGAAQSQSYVQAPSSQTQLNQVLDQRSQLAQSIRNLGVSLYNALLAYQTATATCKDPNIRSAISGSALASMLALGAVKIGIALLDPQASFVVDGQNGEVIISDLGSLTGNSSVSLPASPSSSGASQTLEDVAAKLSFVATALTIIGPLLLKHGIKQASTKTQETTSKIKDSPIPPAPAAATDSLTALTKKQEALQRDLGKLQEQQALATIKSPEEQQAFQITQKKAQLQQVETQIAAEKQKAEAAQMAQMKAQEVKKWGNRVLIGVGVTSIVGTLAFAIGQGNADPATMIANYAHDVIALTDPVNTCQVAAQNIQQITQIDSQASSMRNQLQTLQAQIPSTAE